MNIRKRYGLLCIIWLLIFAIEPAACLAWKKRPQKSSRKPSPSPTQKAYPSPAQKASPSPSSLPASSPSPQATINPFQDEKPVPFEFDEAGMKKLQVSSCGYDYEITGYQQKDGEILIPLSEKTTDNILDKFGVSARFDPDTQEVIFTRDRDKEMRMKIDYAVADYIGQKKAIPVPPRVIKGQVHIAPASFSKFLWACYMYDDKKNLYYIDPWVLDVELETNKRGLTKVVTRGTGPFRNRILKLRNPTRFVIDVLNACLDGKARSISHPTLGEIRFSQHQLKGEEGNIVRIVIPESEEIEVALSQARALNYVEAELRRRSEAEAMIDLVTQRITDVSATETEDQTVITLSATGPIQMEWSRLLSPDDRFFIDIPGALLPEKKKEIALNNEFLPRVVIAQNQPPPNPRVRMVLPLEGPKKVSITPDEADKNKVRITVSKEDIDPDKTARVGFLITYYPTKGMVICIDPGHGGSDPGAVNRSIGLKEKDVTWDISQRLKALLKKEGWTVIMTRQGDQDVTYAGSPDFEELGARTSVANDLKVNVFLSIHINASVVSRVCGIATYWYKESDRELSRHIHNALASRMERPDLGLRRERFYVLRRTNMPGSLLEICFISNPEEAKLLKKPEFRQKAAESIMQGLRSYASTASAQKKPAPSPKPPPAKKPAPVKKKK
jgi:N-acetylmuramoyl-L-alanine amidase